MVSTACAWFLQNHENFCLALISCILTYFRPAAYFVGVQRQLVIKPTPSRNKQAKSDEIQHTLFQPFA